MYISSKKKKKCKLTQVHYNFKLPVMYFCSHSATRAVLVYGTWVRVQFVQLSSEQKFDWSRNSQVSCFILCGLISIFFILFRL